jgi:tripartite-type tricarboxylate transporter receptor subunit TctC
MVQKSGIPFVHVPYRGVAPALQDLLGGQIGFTFGPAHLAAQYAKKGQASVLAVAGPRRSPLLPDVPTFAEQGYDAPALRLTAWVGLLAPAGTPEAVTAVLHRQVQQALEDPAFRGFLAGIGFEPVGSTPAQFRQAFEQEFPLVTDLIRSTGLRPE